MGEAGGVMCIHIHCYPRPQGLWNLLTFCVASQNQFTALYTQAGEKWHPIETKTLPIYEA